MKQLQSEIEEFVGKRDWSKFHSPKNLAMALSVEVAELTEIFQWMTEDQSRAVNSETHKHIEEEIGDVMIYLTMLAKAFNINPVTAARQKMELNKKKYPAPQTLDNSHSP